MQGELVGNVLVTGTSDLWLCLILKGQIFWGSILFFCLFFFNWTVSLLAVQQGMDVFTNVQVFFANLLALLWRLVPVSPVWLWYRVSGELEVLLHQYEWEQSWRNPRLPHSLERDWSGAGDRVTEPPAPAMRNFGDTSTSAEGFGYTASAPWADAPADSYRSFENLLPCSLPLDPGKHGNFC